MLDGWLAMLRRYGWDTPLDELTYMTTAGDDEYLKPIYIDKHALKRVSRDIGFKVLGTILTANNHQDCELAHRIACAWTAFRKFSPILLNRNLPIRKRLWVLEKSVSKSLFWCAGSWNLRADQLSKIRGVQYSMVRKMMFFKRGEHELQDFFFMRTTGAIKHILALHSFKTWDEVSHIEVHRWAGTLARLACQDPVRATSHVFAYKDWNWIQDTIACHNKGRQLHGRYLHTWRWERPIYNYYGQNWQNRAQDIDSWKSDLPNYLEHRLQNR